MKVIDLLNKIANDEEMPKVIKVNKIQYEWKDRLYIYVSGSGRLCFDYFIENNKLNDEVEIIEEDKKIRKLPNEVQEPKNFEEVVYIAEDLARKINEIIDKLIAGDDKE